MKVWICIKSIGALIFLSALGASPIQASELILEAYGDSLTAGMLANSNVTKSTELSFVSETMSKLTMYKLTKNREHVKELEKNELAWPARLAQHLGNSPSAIEVRNYGISGARVDALLHEVLEAKPVAVGTKVIALFFIGHNDLCHSDANTNQLGVDYTKDFTRALTEWEKRHQGATAFFIPVADVNELYPVLDNVEWFSGPKASYRCNDSWARLFPYCVPFYKRHLAGTLDDYLVPRIQVLNQSLKAIAKRWAEQSRKNQYISIEFANRPAYEKHHFAVDCYHLSEDGHEALANLIYDELKWRN